MDRQTFTEGDDTAFTYALNGGAGDGWTVADGSLQVTGSAVRRYAITALPSGSKPSDGLFAMVESGRAGWSSTAAPRAASSPSWLSGPCPTADGPVSLEVTRTTTSYVPASARPR